MHFGRIAKFKAILLRFSLLEFLEGFQHLGAIIFDGPLPVYGDSSAVDSKRLPDVGQLGFQIASAGLECYKTV
jgi:hypothetical protein